VTILLVAFVLASSLVLCCHILVLIPVTLLAALTCSMGALSDGQGAAASAFFAIIVPSVALQGGYMIGLTGRDLVAPLLVRSCRAKRIYFRSVETPNRS
jgi:hypothetical protein